LNFFVKKGGKRPMSSMSPIIVLDKNDNVKLILGASGGSKIITAVAQVAIKSLWMNMNIKEAIDESRVHHQLYPNNRVEIEDGFNKV
jgi:gamma-glutamyltranspeptidase/glutathione hydrolase/leukotriene-C4 hydrolase